MPACSDVLRLAAEAFQAGGVLKTVLRQPSTVLPLSQTSHPTSWDSPPSGQPDILDDWAYQAGSPDLVYPSGSGTLFGEVDVPTAGSHEVWLGGSFVRPIKISIDGRLAGAGSHQIDTPRVFVEVGDIDLRAGQHTVVLRSEGAGLGPGTGGPAFPLGPLILSSSTTDLPVTTVPPARARSLCGKSLDWVEVVS